MYIDEKAHGEVQITKLSQAIRIGAVFVPETRLSFQGCVLGTAGKALGWDGVSTITLYEILVAAFPVLADHDLWVAISEDHYWGRKTRAEIVDELEAKGL